jgi:hypothetical protein
MNNPAHADFRIPDFDDKKIKGINKRPRAKEF